MKTFIILIALLYCSFCFAQPKDFPGKNVELLVGKQLKVTEGDEVNKKYGFMNFFKNEKLTSEIKKYDALAGKTFVVTSSEAYYDYTKTKYKLKLEGDRKEVIYFSYDPDAYVFFPFEVVGGLNFTGLICNHMDTIADKFTGDTTIQTPEIDNIISFIKVKRKDGITYYLRALVWGSTPNVLKQGLILLLENNRRLDKPTAEIDVKAKSNGYLYSTMVILSDDDIKLLSENAITDERLYIYDRSIKQGKRGAALLKCLVAN